MSIFQIETLQYNKIINETLEIDNNYIKISSDVIPINQCTICISSNVLFDINIAYSQKIYKIKFNSAEDKKIFISEYNNKTKMALEEIKYPSGNIYYFGKLLNDKPNDTSGTVFYDSPSKKIKYVGGFMDGYFDGFGILYTNNIRIELNNITKNIPCDTGKIIIDGYEIPIDFNHSDNRFDLTDNSVAIDIIKNFVIEGMYFNYLSNDEKIEILNEKLNMLTDTLDRISNVLENMSIFTLLGMKK